MNHRKKQIHAYPSIQFVQIVLRPTVKIKSEMRHTAKIAPKLEWR